MAAYYTTLEAFILWSFFGFLLLMFILRWLSKLNK
jgi:hypothetical protein